MTEPTAVSHDSPAAMDGDLAPDGLDLLHERLRNGPPVPIAEVVDMRAGLVERGRVQMIAAAEPRFANPMGGLHGGLIATLLDSAIGMSALSVLPTGKLFTTLTLEVKYLRATPLDGTELLAEGRVVHAGRRQIAVEGTMHNGRGDLVATATSTCLVID